MRSRKIRLLEQERLIAQISFQHRLRERLIVDQHLRVRAALRIEVVRFDDRDDQKAFDFRKSILFQRSDPAIAFHEKNDLRRFQSHRRLSNIVKVIPESASAEIDRIRFVLLKNDIADMQVRMDDPVVLWLDAERLDMGDRFGEGRDI